MRNGSNVFVLHPKARGASCRVLLAALAILWTGPWIARSQQSTNESTPSHRWHTIAPKTPQDLQRLFAQNGEPLPLVSAHRGGPTPGFPENCLATFEHTLRHTYAILEIDPRRTKDGAVVLLHDATLDRTTTGQGRLADHTLEEIKRLKLKDSAGVVTDQLIPTLDEALEWARGKTILVLDQKDVPLAERIGKIEEHHAEAYAMLIVYSFQDALACYARNTNLMMEVMIPTVDQVAKFGATGVPWRNVIAFVGHTPPKDPGLYALIHDKGARCLIGTSRNLDQQFLTGQAPDLVALEPNYRALLQRGADVIETDIPAELGRMLHSRLAPPPSIEEFFLAPASEGLR